MDKRRELLVPIEGEVLEIGFGTGLNIPFYGNVDSLYALNPIQIFIILALNEFSMRLFILSMYNPVQKNSICRCKFRSYCFHMDTL
jgi:hypothetical protein